MLHGGIILSPSWPKISVTGWQVFVTGWHWRHRVLVLKMLCLSVLQISHKEWDLQQIKQVTHGECDVIFPASLLDDRGPGANNLPRVAVSQWNVWLWIKLDIEMFYLCHLNCQWVMSVIAVRCFSSNIPTTSRWGRLTRRCTFLLSFLLTYWDLLQLHYTYLLMTPGDLSPLTF